MDGNFDFWFYLGAIAVLADIVLIVAACLVGAPALIIIARILSIVVIADAIHEFNELLSAGSKPLKDEENKIKNEISSENLALAEINDLKSNGGDLTKIFAADMEIV